MNPSAELGGVSRPSSSAWTRTDGTPSRAASSTSATQVAVVGVDAARADQPDRVEPARPFARSHAARSAGR